MSGLIIVVMAFALVILVFLKTGSTDGFADIATLLTALAALVAVMHTRQPPSGP